MGGWSSTPSAGGSGFTGTYGSGTITADTPITFTQTWNNSGVTFTGYKVNVTDTTSNSASKLLDLQVGGTTKFNVDKAGQINTPWGYIGNLSGDLLIANEINNNIFLKAGGNVRFVVNQFATVFLANGSGLGFAANNVSVDVAIFRAAANTLAQAYGTNAQTFQIYGSIDTSTGIPTTNYSRLKITHGGGTAGATIATEAGGTGTAGPLALVASSVKVGTNTVVASLPSASTAGAGARSFVTDATAPTFGATVAGGGAVSVPVYSNGTSWLVG